jgi:hypothetical protein
MKRIHIYRAILLLLLILPFSGNAQNSIKKTDPTAALSVSVDIKDASGEDIDDAYIRIKVTGGKAPYAIHCFSPYSLPTQYSGNELNLEKIKSGDYLFVIQDSGRKSLTKEIKISIIK